VQRLLPDRIKTIGFQERIEFAFALDSLDGGFEMLTRAELVGGAEFGERSVFIFECGSKCSAFAGMKT
jgi:hypothetical protein